MAVLWTLAVMLSIQGCSSPESKHVAIQGDGPGESNAKQQARMRTAMETIFTKDGELCATLDPSIKSGLRPADAVLNISATMKAFDMSECPPDFRIAYVKHANAWERLGLLLAQEPQSVVENLAVLLEMASDFVHGELDAGIGRQTREQYAYLQVIQSTWSEVETIAVKYGARLPNRQWTPEPRKGGQ